MVKSRIFDNTQLLKEHPELPHYKEEVVCFRSEYKDKSYPANECYFNRELYMIFVLEDGRVSMSGRPEYIFTQVEELKRVGLDVPQVTELAHELKKAGVDIKEPILTAEEMAEALCR